MLPRLSLPARVLSRHIRAAVVLDDLHRGHRVEYTDSGSIFARQIARWLEPEVGFIPILRFRPAIVGMPNTVAWEAATDTGEVVEGRLILHAGVEEDRVVSWAEVVVDRRPPGDAARRVAPRAAVVLPDLQYGKTDITSTDGPVVTAGGIAQIL